MRLTVRSDQRSVIAEYGRRVRYQEQVEVFGGARGGLVVTTLKLGNLACRVGGGLLVYWTQDKAQALGTVDLKG